MPNSRWEDDVVDWWMDHWELLYLCFAFVVIIGLVMCYEVVTNHNMEMNGEMFVRTVDKTVDEVEDLGVEGVGVEQTPVWRVTPGNENRFIATVVLAAKVKFGTPKQDKPDIAASNRLVVRRFCSDLMAERGMRPTHIAQFIDIIVEMVFIPSTKEIVAKQLSATHAWQTRLDAYKELDRPRGRLMTRIRRVLAAIIYA